MKKALIAVLLTGVFVMPGFAAEGEERPQGQRPTLGEKRAEILKHLEQKIAATEAEKACVMAAASQEELKACKERFRSERKGGQQDRRN